MASFCVFQSPDGRPGRPVFIRDGFSAGAACLGAAWFIWRREWSAAAAWVAAMFLVTLGGAALALDASAIAGAILALCVFTGLEAATIRARGLERRGYRLSSVIERRTLTDAETVHFARELVGEAARVSAGPPRRAGEAEQVGLFIEGPK
jgi:hypothetical protein